MSAVFPVKRPLPGQTPVRGRPASRGSQGFALLAALLIASIALLATASLVALTLSNTSIAADDAASSRAADLARAGVSDALERLRWGWLRCGPASSSSRFGPVESAGGSYRVTVEPLSAGDATPRLDASSAVAPSDPQVAAVRITATGSWGRARRVAQVAALCTPDGLARGLVVGADVTLQAPTELRGCGLYAGADVNGREWLTVAPSPDLAYGGLYAVTGVHSDGHIFTRGAEEHAAPGAPAADTDSDGGIVPPLALVAAPSPAVVGALASHASDPAAALGPLGLDLSLLDRTVPGSSGGPASPADGVVVVIQAGDTALRVFGDRPAAPQACPVTVVVVGDCIAGTADGSSSALQGALVVTGTLTVSAPFSVDGGLYAGRLVVCAPLAVSFSDSSNAGAAPGRANVRDVWWRW